MFEELLNYIVAKNIGHELESVRKELPEELILFVAICRFELLLDEARSVLITTKFHYVVIYILNDVSARYSNIDMTYLEIVAFVGLAIVPKVLKQGTPQVTTGVGIPRSTMRLGIGKDMRC